MLHNTIEITETITLPLRTLADCFERALRAKAKWGIEP
jgi:hypothetical protein